MGEKKATLFVEDMACQACERKIKEAVGRLKGVSTVSASLRGGRVEATFDEDRVKIEEIRKAIQREGYSLGNPRKSTLAALGIFMILAGLYSLARFFGLFEALPSINSSLGYGMLFLVGILTSVHCVAMCGGIALSQSVARMPTPRPASSEGKINSGNIGPSLQYNAGRIASYTLIGGLVGLLGATLDFSPAAKGLITILAGLFMILFGLKMLGVLAHFLQPAKPAHLSSGSILNRLASSLKRKGPFGVGFLNGFMPCGPLQSMQLYALGTGSFFAGALSMFLFSLGTAPLMLGFGFIAGLVPRKYFPVMVKSSAFMVLALGILTLGRGGALAGIPMSGKAPTQEIASLEKARNLSQAVIPKGMAIAEVGEKTQIITTDFGSSGSYVPFAVQVGVPLKWTIRVEAEGLNGCNNPITVPALGINKRLRPGDNLIEFTPEKTGTLVYTCWMGMISSKIFVYDPLVY
jgi:copper ion binding protein